MTLRDPGAAGRRLWRRARSPRSVASAAVVLAAVLGLVAGCHGPDRDAAPDRSGVPDGEQVSAPFEDCAGLTGPPAGVEAAAPAPAGGEPLPALTLPCFTGQEPFRLADLRGPAVVNLWASWCEPCREELPAIQRYADRAAGQVRVVGVATGDRRPAAASFATDFGISFPALEDRDQRLLGELGLMTLPVTLLVDAEGRVAHVHSTSALDEPSLRRLVTEHLGVGPGA